MNQEKIIKLATQQGWKLRSHTDPWVLIFDQGGSQINVWYTKMTVGVFVRVKGWTDYKKGVYHRSVNEKSLKNIFKSTSKTGYRESTYKPANKPFKLPKLSIESLTGVI